MSLRHDNGTREPGYSEPEAAKELQPAGSGMSCGLSDPVIHTKEPVRHPPNTDLLGFGCYRKRRCPGAL